MGLQQCRGLGITGTEIYPSDEYYILSTTDSNQIDTSSWLNIISGAITETLNSQTIYYAVSFDDRTIWKVFGLGQSQWRSIAKNDSGTWKYNSNATYSQETWTAASVNSQERALDQAFGISANLMSGANFNNISDVNWEATGGWSISVDTLDFTGGLKTTSTSSSPSLSQITINYDSSGGDALTISTSASGTGEIRPIQFQIGSNEKVLVLDTSGNVFIGGNINTVTSSVSSIFITTVDSVDSTADIPPSLAIADDGFARISYYDDTNENLQFVQCTNDDCSTKSITTVDSSGNVGPYTSLAMGSDGFARISYYNTYNSSLQFVQCTNDDCSTKNATIVDPTGNWVEDISLAIADDGFARISYYDYDNGNLQFVQCTNDDCSTNSTTTVDSAGDVGYYNSLAIADDGFARISYAYWDEVEEISNLKFVQCTNDDCSTNSTTTVDSAGDVGYYNSLAIADDGFARISYYDYDNGNLQFVQCTNDDCSTKNATTVDSTGGNGSSLAIADDGFARISYYDDTNGELKLVQCTNDDCSTNSTTTVDSTGGVFGEYTSLAIGSDGFARISYFEYDYVEQNANLKFARFTNDISFNPDGNDLFVAGSLGVEGNIITDGSLLVNQSAKFGNSVLIGEDSSNILTTFTSSWQKTTVDSSGDVGYYNSLAIADDGFARISYYDGTNEDLKLSSAPMLTAQPTALPPLTQQVVYLVNAPLSP